MLHLVLASPSALFGVLAAVHASGRVPSAIAFDGTDLLLDVDPSVAPRLARRVDVISVGPSPLRVDWCPPPSSPERPLASARPSSTP